MEQLPLFHASIRPLLLYRLGEHRSMVPSPEAVSWFLAPAETLPSEDLLGGSPWDGRSRSRKRGATSSVETGQPVGLSFRESLDFSQSAASSLSPTRLLTESCAGVESSGPCRTSSTDRRVVALPQARWDGTTQSYAPPLWRWCRLPLAILPGLRPDPRGHRYRQDRAQGAGH